MVNTENTQCIFEVTNIVKYHHTIMTSSLLEFQINHASHFQLSHESTST